MDTRLAHRNAIRNAAIRRAHALRNEAIDDALHRLAQWFGLRRQPATPHLETAPCRSSR